jgi:hypothetical protein
MRKAKNKHNTVEDEKCWIRKISSTRKQNLFETMIIKSAFSFTTETGKRPQEQIRSSKASHMYVSIRYDRITLVCHWGIQQIELGHMQKT